MDEDHSSGCCRWLLLCCSLHISLHISPQTVGLIDQVMLERVCSANSSCVSCGGLKYLASAVLEPPVTLYHALSISLSCFCMQRPHPPRHCAHSAHQHEQEPPPGLCSQHEGWPPDSSRVLGYRTCSVPYPTCARCEQQLLDPMAWFVTHPGTHQYQAQHLAASNSSRQCGSSKWSCSSSISWCQS
jgi:hypothetical protein